MCFNSWIKASLNDNVWPPVNLNLLNACNPFSSKFSSVSLGQTCGTPKPAAQITCKLRVAASSDVFPTFNSALVFVLCVVHSFIMLSVWLKDSSNTSLLLFSEKLGPTIFLCLRHSCPSCVSIDFPNISTRPYSVGFVKSIRRVVI